jgi:hypothetical protein
MEKLLLTVWEAADVLSVSRSRVYELLYAEQPVWTGAGYCDPDTGVMLPTWRQALDQLDADPDVGPVHVMRFGTQHDIAGIIAPSADADRAVRYLAKYLTKAIGDPLGENSESDDVLSPDGLPRYAWTDERPDPTTYTLMLLRAVAERQRWRDNTTRPRPEPRLRLWTVFRQSARPAAADRPVPRLPTARPHPIIRQIQGRRTGSQG